MNFYRKNNMELAQLSPDFLAKITAQMVALGLVQSQIDSYETVNTNFLAALSTATDPATRTSGSITARNQARKNLVTVAKVLSDTIIANPNVTNATLQDLGLDPRTSRVPTPPPTAEPNIEVISVKNNLVKITLKPVGSDRPRAKPVGANGISVWTYVGQNPPTDPQDWVFNGNTGRTIMDVQFDDSLTPGTKVWFTAFYFNAKKESGPSAQPVSAYLLGGSIQLAA